MIAVLVFFSGAAALIYEVVWSRLLLLALGAGAQSLAVAAAGTMLGLAAGAELGGRLADRRVRSLSLFASIQTFAGITAIISTFALREGAEVAMPWPFFLLLVAAPNVLLGAALPSLAPELATRDDIAGGMSALYAANTAGALLGTLCAGFWLIERWGLGTTAVAAAGLNIAVGEAARRHVSHGTRHRERGSAPEEIRSDGLFGAAISGLTVMGLEVLDARLLVHAFHATTHAIAIILAAFIAGLALGSALCSRLLRRAGDRLAQLGAVLLASAAAMLATAPALAQPHSDFGAAWGARLLSEAAASALLLIPAATVMGLAFPLALAAALKSERPGASTGRVFFVNASFAALGSLGAAFFLLPAFGIRASIAAIAVMQSLAGAYLLRRRWAVGACVAFAAWGAVWARPPALGARPGLGTLVPAHLAGRESGFVVLCYREGALATTEVVEDVKTGWRTLFVDGFVTAGESATSAYMSLMGRLPMLLHPEPKRALVICLGGGATARAVSEWKDAALDIVDVNPDVFGCAPTFGRDNVEMLSRAGRFVEDGRRFLRREGPGYDVITQEPMPPYFAGTAALYSVEYYRLAKKRLNPGGVMAQWLPLHLVTPRDARQIVAAALEVFPETWVALAPGGETAIVLSSNEPLDAARRKKAEMQLEAEFLLDPAAAARYAAGAEPVTDDKPSLEYSGIDRVRGTFPSPDELAAFNIAEMRRAAAP